jgi:protocatechuate 3,4-dioxygenase, alpha subunit
MEKTRRTPSQTIGPFFAYSLTAEQYGYDFNSIVNGVMTDLHTEGERITVTVQVLDGAGNPVNDALVELWQADSKGNYRLTPIQGKNDGFTGFGRLGTGKDVDNRVSFTTLKPAASAETGGGAPHINVLLFMRGSLHNLYTRLYFSDEKKANAADPLLKAVKTNRRETLIAQREVLNEQVFYHFTIRMQGAAETVFFAI